MTVSARTYISGARQPFQSRESVTQKPVEGSQHRPLAFSPEGIELKAESGVLHSQSRMTAEEESRETKHKQHEGRHEARFLVYIVMKVKPLRVGGLLANHRFWCKLESGPNVDWALLGTASPHPRHRRRAR